VYNLVYTKGDGENAIRKPLYECNTEESLDLKAILFGKYQKLASIGKPTAMQFLKMMQSVDEHIQNIQLEIMKKEAEKANEEVKEKPDAKISDGSRTKRYNPNRWTNGVNPIT
jgi:hypothetical protein